MSLEKLIDTISSHLSKECRERMKPPADSGAMDRLENSMVEWLDGKKLTIHQSLRNLYDICGGEKPDSGTERKLFGFHHRLLTPDQARSAYEELMKERLHIEERYGDPNNWFLSDCIPFAECSSDAEFLCMSAKSGVVLVKNSIGMMYQHDSIEDKLLEVIEEYSKA